MVDTHCHLHFSEYTQDRETVFQRSWESGIEALILVGCDAEDSSQAMALAQSVPNAFFSAGFHPHEASRWNLQKKQKLEELSRDPKCVAVGEVGLDYYRNLSPKEDQRRVFIEMLTLAKSRELPLIIHCRQAADEMVSLLKEQGPFPSSGVMHCFSGDSKYLEDCLKLGFYVSFAGNLTFANAEELRERAAEVPIERLLTETDSPYLTPAPFRGTRNEPCRIAHTIAKLAEIQRKSPEEMSKVTAGNARRLFRLGTDEKT